MTNSLSNLLGKYKIIILYFKNNSENHLTNNILRFIKNRFTIL